ncbi:hypothetical protein FNW02_32630 [Komarekiella sp. 'clone 1']|uniref:Uncharacterized protein n=1 Tax=Komarekiella delphini-convector SJRDD-AB1 TaxID=2593771 RepID=A0AA40T3R5_9NOST|nr:hypothetical protein [Komarekiella delphini-convector]MBD6620403.1 hypothetical protein [Komarekiella delphini-convector SJRDD-AB1]
MPTESSLGDGAKEIGSEEDIAGVESVEIMILILCPHRITSILTSYGTARLVKKTAKKLRLK